MATKIDWNLPEGVEEILPPKAMKVEKLRRKLIDLYVSSGYEFILPPLIEFSETLGGEAHEELSSYAFTFKDELSGINLSIRPDISEQASRIDAYRIESIKPVRLCYAGDVVKNKISPIHRSRTTIQVGAEIYGDHSMNADLESIQLMIKSLINLGIDKITLSLGHAGLISLVIKELGKNTFSHIQDIEAALSRKSQSDIRALSNKNLTEDKIKLLLDLCNLYGKKEILDSAHKKLKILGKEAKDYLSYLERVVENLDLDERVKIHIDLGEVHGFRYHNGIVFSAFIENAGYCLSKGGRYDGLSKVENLPRSAVGFDLDLLAVVNFANIS